jgi:hypothetical protein
VKHKEAEPIQSVIPNEHHMRVARVAIEYISQCYKYNQGPINSEFSMYGMEEYQDFVTLAPYICNALMEVERIVHLGDIRAFAEIAKTRSATKAIEKETDEEIIARMFPIK